MLGGLQRVVAILSAEGWAREFGIMYRLNQRKYVLFIGTGRLRRSLRPRHPQGLHFCVETRAEPGRRCFAFMRSFLAAV